MSPVFMGLPATLRERGRGKMKVNVFQEAKEKVFTNLSCFFIMTNGYNSFKRCRE
jgi:hypothetical protein